MGSTTEILRPVRRGVIGVLSRGREFLMVQRSQSVPLPGMWCFPGGHIEPNETSRRAIIRELAEELGVAVVPTHRLGAVRVESTRYVLAVWMVHHEVDEFRLAEKEIADLRWVRADEVTDITPGLASNAKVATMLQSMRFADSG